MRHVRLRALCRHRPRSRRPRRSSAGTRSSGSRDAPGRARHRADLLPLHARHDRVRPGLLPLVQLSAAGPGAGEPAQRGDRAAGRAHDDRGATRNISASGAIPPTFTGCARTIAPARRSISNTTRPTWTRRSPVPCSRSGARRHRWAGSTTCSSIWRERAANVSGRSLPAGHNLQEDAPELVAAELRAFLRGNGSPLARVRRGRFSRR